MPVEISNTDLLILTTAYLLGSVSSAVLACRLLGLSDPRTTGSHNPGATNVWRTGSQRAGAITLVADLLKGALPVWLAQQLRLDNSIIVLCGLCAMIGHLFPLYFRFHGGKGVATFLGSCLALVPVLALCQFCLWLLLAKLTRHASAASLCTALATPVLCYWLIPAALMPTQLPILSLMALLLILRHRSNIHKLLRGSELRF